MKSSEKIAQQKKIGDAEYCFSEKLVFPKK